LGKATLYTKVKMEILQRKYKHSV